MAFSFDFTVKNVHEAFIKAKNAGAPITGNESSGTFNGSGVVGSYRVNGNNIHVQIDKKPGVVTQGFVEKKLKAFFN